MQDRAKANHVLDKSSMVGNPIYLVTLSVRMHAILAKIHDRRFRLFPVLRLDSIP